MILRRLPQSLPPEDRVAPCGSRRIRLPGSSSPAMCRGRGAWRGAQQLGSLQSTWSLSHLASGRAYLEAKVLPSPGGHLPAALRSTLETNPRTSKVCRKEPCYTQQFQGDFRALREPVRGHQAGLSYKKVMTMITMISDVCAMGGSMLELLCDSWVSSLQTAMPSSLPPHVCPTWEIRYCLQGGLRQLLL